MYQGRKYIVLENRKTSSVGKTLHPTGRLPGPLFISCHFLPSESLCSYEKKSASAKWVGLLCGGLQILGGTIASNTVLTICMHMRLSGLPKKLMSQEMFRTTSASHRGPRLVWCDLQPMSRGNKSTDTESLGHNLWMGSREWGVVGRKWGVTANRYEISFCWVKKMF